MLRNLKIWQRLVILAAAFMVPVLALLYFLVGEQGLAIGFARKELAGIEYLRSMRPLLADLLAERDLQAAIRSGDAARQSELASKTTAIQADFAALDDTARKLSGQLDTYNEQRDAIRRAWNDPAQSGASSEGPNTLVVQEVLRHLVAVGNSSNLVLDPDVDSYYSMDAVVFKLPKLLAELSDARGEAFGVVRRLEEGGAAVSAADKEVLRSMAVTIGEALTAGRDNIEYAFQYNPEVARRLQPLLRNSAGLTEAVVQTLSGNTGSSRTAKALFADATAAIDANFRSYDAAMDVLDGLIQKRLAGFQRRRAISFSVIALSLIISLSVVFSLQREVETRTEELSKALDQFQLAQQQLVSSEKMAALGNLVAGISHEVNTPIGIGVTAATSLEDETQRLDDLVNSGKMKRSDLDSYVRTSRELSGLILSNLDRASELIQSFKQVAVDQSSESRRQFQLKGYLEEIVQSLYPNLKKTKHTVQIDCDETITLDTYPGALSQIVTNFVANSLFHGFGPDDKGMIRIRAAALFNSSVRLTYFDNGRGIPKQHLDRIFEPFFTTKRGEGGSGLGLNIVHNLVTQKLKGQIHCESEQNKGTTFIIDIPNLPAES